MPLIDPANWFRVSWKKKKKIIQTNTYIRDRRKEHQIKDISPPSAIPPVASLRPEQDPRFVAWRSSHGSRLCIASLHCIIIVHRSASKQYDGEEVHVKSGSSECTVTLYPLALFIIRMPYCSIRIKTCIILSASYWQCIVLSASYWQCITVNNSASCLASHEMIKTSASSLICRRHNHHSMLTLSNISHVALTSG